MKTAVPKILEDCLGLLLYVLTESRHRRFDTANKALAVAMLRAAEMPKEFHPDFRAAWLYCTMLVHSRESGSGFTPEMRSQAGALLEQSKAMESVDLFQNLMFQVLVELGESRRAIPFGERVLALAVEANDTLQTGDSLWKIGGCYSRLGLRDHATIAYRGALRIFRNETADPRLPVVLLALDNALRKSEPAETEALYKEAAGLWESKGHLESATPAWMNLGIVCSDQQRFDEAIHYYGRVRQIRESSPGTPPVRIGVLHNNLAGCYRKMKRFGEAHQACDRAIAILSTPGALGPTEGNSLGSALGTKGLILRDEGRDADSVDWFRRACAQFEKQPTPNSENIVEELEYQAAALTRLGRTQEALAVQEKMESVRRSAAEVPAISRSDDTPVELPEGALIIELDGGIRSKSVDPEFEQLGKDLRELLKEQNLGDWRGFIRTPEASTLIYHGPDAEAMYTAVEPGLRAMDRFEGALITIRQGIQQRQVVRPRRRVN